MYDSDSDSYWPDAQITPDDYGNDLNQSYLNALAQQEENEFRASDQMVADSIEADPKYGYGDYGNPKGIGGEGTSTTISPSGLAGSKNALSKLFRNKKGEIDYAKLAMLLYGAKTLAKGNKPAAKAGFQGVIPTSTATRNLLTAPPPGRKPGAYGINYGGDPVYTRLAEGGLANLAKGRYLQGETDGMADQIPAQIGNDQPAALSHGEFVIPADVVSHLGNGNSDAGAKKLYQMMDKVRQARTGNKKQGKKINPDKFMPGGLALAYANGGKVLKFEEGGAAPVSKEETLSSWSAPYVTNMLSDAEALSKTPYQAYTGRTTAGPSALQTKVSEGLGAANFPSNLGKSFSSSGAYRPPAMNMDAYKTQPIGTGNYNRPSFESYASTLQPGQDPAVNKNVYDAGLAGKGIYDSAAQKPVPAPGTSEGVSGLPTGFWNDMRQMPGENIAAEYTDAQASSGQPSAEEVQKMRESNPDMDPNSMMAQRALNQALHSGQSSAMPQMGIDNLYKNQSFQQSQEPQGIASEYMNPYLQSVLTPQMEELRRQNDITNMNTNAMFTKAGAFGGGRQAIMNAENNRNLLQAQNKALAEGYSSAYDKAMGQFNTEQTQGQALAKMMADQGATDRAMDAEQVEADLKQFEEARANPYKQLQFRQSMLDKLPIQTTNTSGVTPSMLEKLSGNMKTTNELLERLGLLDKDA